MGNKGANMSRWKILPNPKTGLGHEDTRYCASRYHFRLSTRHSRMYFWRGPWCCWPAGVLSVFRACCVLGFADLELSPEVWHQSCGSPKPCYQRSVCMFKNKLRWYPQQLGFCEFKWSQILLNLHQSAKTLNSRFSPSGATDKYRYYTVDHVTMLLHTGLNIHAKFWHPISKSSAFSCISPDFAYTYAAEFLCYFAPQDPCCSMMFHFLVLLYILCYLFI